jgi:zeaxanthin glucosyltransferase
MRTSNLILFIYPVALGHITKTLKIARFFERNGYSILYLLQGKNTQFCKENGFNYQILESNIFGYYNEKNNQGKKFSSYLEEFKNRKFTTKFEERNIEINKYLEQYKPKYIFIDVFCISDFLFCYNYSIINKVKTIGLTPFFPEIENSSFPPLNYYEFPGEAADISWLKKKKKIKKKEIKNIFLFPLRSDKYLIKKAMKKLQIPEKFTPNYWERYPIFKGMEFWYLQPKELDFEEQSLHFNHKYMGPMIELVKDPISSLRLNFFLKLKEKSHNSKLIFCTLGTIINQLISEELIISYFSKVIEIAKLNPTWFIIIRVPRSFEKQLKVTSINIIVLSLSEQIEYLTLLSKADVFLTHGGGNSYLEALYSKTPLIVFPPIDYWDYNGVAARIVYHKLGLKLDFESNVESIQNAIHSIFNNGIFQENVDIMGDFLLTNYEGDYFKDNFDLNS